MQPGVGPEEILNIRACMADIAFSFKKKPFVFRVKTADLRQYLLQVGGALADAVKGRLGGAPAC